MRLFRKFAFLVIPVVWSITSIMQASEQQPLLPPSTTLALPAAEPDYPKGFEEYLDLATPKEEATYPTQNDLFELFWDVYYNPVAKLEMLPVYDPQNLTGFCFGRAMAAHFATAEFGTPYQDVKKLFVVGDLKGRTSEITEWRFHVTTVVKGADGEYWTLDPIMNRPITMTQWIQNTQLMWDRWYLDHPDYDEPQAKYYLTHANAILPDIRDFKQIPDETGETIIELSFEPESQGFAKVAYDAVPLYELRADETNRFFLVSGVKEAENQFDFERLSFTDGFEVDYNDFFFDLFETFVDGPSREIFGLQLATND